MTRSEIEIPPSAFRRFRGVLGSYCPRCKTETSDMFVCERCGNSHGFGGSLDAFAVIEERWIPHPVKWWNPFSWAGGTWIPVYRLATTDTKS